MAPAQQPIEAGAQWSVGRVLRREVNPHGQATGPSIIAISVRALRSLLTRITSHAAAPIRRGRLCWLECDAADGLRTWGR